MFPPVAPVVASPRSGLILTYDSTRKRRPSGRRISTALGFLRRRSSGADARLQTCHRRRLILPCPYDEESRAVPSSAERTCAGLPVRGHRNPSALAGSTNGREFSGPHSQSASGRPHGVKARPARRSGAPAGLRRGSSGPDSDRACRPSQAFGRYTCNCGSASQGLPPFNPFVFRNVATASTATTVKTPKPRYTHETRQLKGRHGVRRGQLGEVETETDRERGCGAARRALADQAAVPAHLPPPPPQR